MSWNNDLNRVKSNILPSLARCIVYWEKHLLKRFNCVSKSLSVVGLKAQRACHLTYIRVTNVCDEKWNEVMVAVIQNDKNTIDPAYFLPWRTQICLLLLDQLNWRRQTWRTWRKRRRFKISTTVWVTSSQRDCNTWLRTGSVHGHMHPICSSSLGNFHRVLTERWLRPNDLASRSRLPFFADVQGSFEVESL